jgi:hypothetical protein
MRRLAVTFVLLGCLGAAPRAVAQTTSCQPIFDAMLKEAETPHHVVSTRNGQPAGELISTKDTMFVKAHDAWKKSPLTPQDYLKQQRENIKSVSTSTCQQLPDEAVDGAAAAVYNASYDMKGMGRTEAKIWIAKATGLPVRTDESMRAGEHVSEVHRFDYVNISPPK